VAASCGLSNSKSRTIALVSRIASSTISLCFIARDLAPSDATSADRASASIFFRWASISCSASTRGTLRSSASFVNMLVQDCHCSAMVPSNACTVRIKADLARALKERVDRGLERRTGSISCLAATPPAATVQSPLARLERLWSCPGWWERAKRGAEAYRDLGCDAGGRYRGRNLQLTANLPRLARYWPMRSQFLCGKAFLTPNLAFAVCARIPREGRRGKGASSAEGRPRQ